MLQTQGIRAPSAQGGFRHQMPATMTAKRLAPAVVPLGRTKSTLVARSSRDSSGFWGGFITGGILLGAVGYVFAPQISKALLGEDQKLRLPRFLEEQSIDPEVSKQNLADQIAQLNSTIDNIHQSLNPPIVNKEEVPAQS